MAVAGSSGDVGGDDIMCLVEIPAQYQTVAKRVLKTPASSREVTVPAKYATVTKQVVDQGASSRDVDVPAQYTTVTRRVLDLEGLRTRGHTVSADGTVTPGPNGERIVPASTLVAPE